MTDEKMVALNVRQFPAALLAALKVQAINGGMTLRELVIARLYIGLNGSETVKSAKVKAPPTASNTASNKVAPVPKVTSVTKVSPTPEKPSKHKKAPVTMIGGRRLPGGGVLLEDEDGESPSL